MAATHAPAKPGNQEADERDGDHDGPRRDEGDRHGVEELLIVEPVEFLHHAAVEKRDDRQPAAEDEGARFGEVKEDSPEQCRRRPRAARSRAASRTPAAQRGRIAAAPSPATPGRPPSKNTHTISDSVTIVHGEARRHR